MRILIIFIIISLMASGCSTLNILKTDRDYAKDWFAIDLKEGIDHDIKNEVAGLRPNGIELRVEQPWQQYWKRRIRNFEARPLSDIKGYKGPEAKWFIDYIIRERKNAGLPDIKTTEPNQRIQTMRLNLPINSIAQGPHV